MDRSAFMMSAGALALGATLPNATDAAASEAMAADAGPDDVRLLALLDTIFYARLEDSPERATGLGLDKGGRAHLRGRLDDYSAAGHARRLARSKAEKGDARRIARSKAELATLRANGLNSRE